VQVRLPSIGAIPGDLDNFTKPRLIDGQRFRLPCCDARLTKIHDGDLDVRVLLSYDGACRTALQRVQSVEDSRRRRWLNVRRTYHVAGADAADVGDLA
jgi:hypothetical protein